MLADGTFDFELRKSIEVSGCDSPVTTLTFHECGEGYDSYYMKLRKFAIKAQTGAVTLIKQFGDMKDILDQIKKEDDSLISGKEIKSFHEMTDEEHDDETEKFADLLKMSLGTSDDLEDLIKVFGHMVGNSGNKAICTTEGVRIKEGAWARIHPEDKIDAAVKYCSFFGIGLDQTNNNTSEAAPVSLTEAKVL